MIHTLQACFVSLLLLTFLGCKNSGDPGFGSSGENANPQEPDLARSFAQARPFAIADIENGNNFVKIDKGTFLMGSPASEGDRFSEELHQVTLTSDFEIQVTLVTQAQYFKLMSKNPTLVDSAYCPNEFVQIYRTEICVNHPVANVSWYEVLAFIDKLNFKDRKHIYRLPTEAEWEYVARAGSQNANWFDNLGNRDNYAWPLDESFPFNVIHPVGEKRSNKWGVYDMVSLINQWVSDFYGPYSATAQVDPQGASVGNMKVFRGGNSNTRSAWRSGMGPSDQSTKVGFRLVRTLRPVN